MSRTVIPRPLSDDGSITKARSFRRALNQGDAYSVGAAGNPTGMSGNPKGLHVGSLTKAGPRNDFKSKTGYHGRSKSSAGASCQEFSHMGGGPPMGPGFQSI